MEYQIKIVEIDQYILNVVPWKDNKVENPSWFW